MRVSGSMTRRMGLRRSESSPEIMDLNGWPDSTPASRRSVVPELPASSARRGRRRPPRPAPVMRTRPFSVSMATPRRRRHSSVQWQSSAVEKCWISLLPSARAARMA